MHCKVVGKEDILCSDKPSLNKWTKVALSYLLDVALENARVLCLINKKCKELQPFNEATLELAKALISPFADSRKAYSNASTLTYNSQSTFPADDSIVVTSVPCEIEQISKKQRKISDHYCKRCFETVHASNAVKILKTRYACARCDVPVCSKHRLVLCKQCL